MPTQQENLPVYIFDKTPLTIIENACAVRNNGRPCSMYSCMVEEIEGKKAQVHRCSGNPTFCDYIIGVALELSDEGSGLHKKVFGKR